MEILIIGSTDGIGKLTAKKLVKQDFGKAHIEACKDKKVQKLIYVTEEYIVD